ncbi:MAG: hypothetical protein PHP44_11275 [Kiritimatiellae bacterium]|nr:hypothetical protein [Kiritimatiellia bacterium]
MHNKKKCFLKILEIEFDDLREDIDLLIQHCCDEEQEGLLTEHVFFSNIAIFRNEERGLDQFVAIVRQTDPEAYSDMNALMAYIKEAFAKKIRECGLAPFINGLVERKIEKVIRYVNQ